MNDILDVHEERELPDAVRDNARRRLQADMQRPGRTVGWAPLAIASVVVLLAAGAVVFTIGPSRSQQVPPLAGNNSRDDWAYVAEELYKVQDRAAPADQAARCVAAGAGDWKPLVTVSARGATVITYSTEAGPRFCELTPSTVTLSAPVVAASAGVKATFVSESGTVAGVLDPAFEIMRIGPSGEQMPQLPAVVRDGVFVSPNNLVRGFQGLAMVLGGSPKIMGGPRSVPAADVPSVTPAVVDRPQPPAERTSDGGRRLADCFDRMSWGRPVDPANWVATESLQLNRDETLQLGRYGDLLAVCVVFPDHVSVVIDDGMPMRSDRDREVQSNPYLFSTTMFYDFRQRPGGHSSSDTVVVAGLVTSPEVAAVTISRPESPDVRAEVHNGTFALPNIWLNEGVLEDQYKSMITVLDAKGTVLARLPIRI